MFDRLRRTFGGGQKAIEIPAEADIFEDLFGLDDVKELFMAAISASGPVNLMTVGPPGCGKSKILECIRDAFPRLTVYVDGTSCTGAGIQERIFAAYDRSSQIRVEKKMFLCIDEIEKADKKAREMLLTAVEKGEIVRTNKKDYRELKLQVWLFATCNSVEKMQKTQPELLSRLEMVRIDPLTLEQFSLYARDILMQKEGINEELAYVIADTVYNEFSATSVRKCIRIARMCKNEASVLRIVQHFKAREVKEMGQ